MNFSGIVVSADPSHFDAVVAALEAVPGIEVHHCDRISARLIVVQEAADVHAEVEGFRRIRALPHVLGADLVYHYFGDQTDAEPDLAALLARLDDAEARPPRMCH
ncbi:nitrate reductase formation protein NapD [Betaproteobacteria bacterium PRO7]|jgi:nitrate reductase NapD|nr:chaperone NapD [Burkholderiaceae bacterium]MDL1863267.1 nitrate reductase formation protein NapD [Betaproteobacteria bacterium PRO7]GIL05899.1 MAG: hypothetical protein BroJett031_24190 [Betaproteobacteria bacterium]